MPNLETEPPNRDPPAAEVRAALDRVLASGEFLRSGRLSGFLRYVVDAALDGRAHLLKGYTIGVEALGRPERFDPDADAVVRVTASRVRVALARYYADEGRDDPVIIEMPPGSYVPMARWARDQGPLDVWTRARRLFERLLAATGVRLLGPRTEQPRQSDDREARQIQQVEGAVAARVRRPRRG